MISGKGRFTNIQESGGMRRTRATLPVRMLLPVCTLAACNAAGPHFRHLPATQITVEGSVFDVRVNRRLAEAIRVTREYAPRLGPVAGRAALAMELVSGCEVTQVRGDAAQVTGLLDCGAGPPPPVLVPGYSYECYADSRYVRPDDDDPFEDYTCDPVAY